MDTHFFFFSNSKFKKTLSLSHGNLHQQFYPKQKSSVPNEKELGKEYNKKKKKTLIHTELKKRKVKKKYKRKPNFQDI